MGRIVVACYRPRPGLDADLIELTRTHVPRLRAQGLATDRAPVIAVAADGTVVEVFEWTSAAAIEAAHSNPEVRAMWEEYDRVCTHVPIGEVEGASDLFTELTPVVASDKH